MAKKVQQAAHAITTKKEAIAALKRLEEIQVEIEEALDESVRLKKGATAWAAETRTTVIQLDGAYYRLVQRYSRSWDEAKLRKLVKDVKVNGKALWNLITTRQPDPDKIQAAVAQGWIKQKEVDKAFIEKPQAPFLQRYVGEAEDG